MLIRNFFSFLFRLMMSFSTTLISLDDWTNWKGIPHCVSHAKNECTILLFNTYQSIRHQYSIQNCVHHRILQRMKEYIEKKKINIHHIAWNMTNGLCKLTGFAVSPLRILLWCFFFFNFQINLTDSIYFYS